MRLTALALGVSLWYIVLPATALFDAAFLVLIAAVMVGRYFESVYPVIYHQHIDISGACVIPTSPIS